MMKLTTGRLLCASVLALAILSLSFAFPAETVNFGLVPDAGLKVRMTEVETIKIEGKLVMGEGEMEMELTQAISGKEVFVQTIKKVENGKILEILRDYEEAGQKVVSETSMSEEPQEQEQSSPLAWKHIRASWNDDDERTVKVKDDDAWKDAGDDIKKRLTTRKLRQPKIPFPSEEKKVGDEWEMNAKELKDYFADSAQAANDQDVEIDGNAKFKFAEITDVKGVKCAVIDFEFALNLKIADSPSPEFSIKGKVLYSIDHRCLYGMKGEGTLKIEGEREQMGQTVNMNLEGKIKVDVKVKIETEDKAGDE